MDTVWWVLGGVILVATLLDVVLTALSDDEAGFLAGPFSRGLWSTPPARRAVQAALAVGAGSVEQRPAAVWSVTYDVRYPVRALERGAGRARDLRGLDRVDQALVLLISRPAPDAVEPVDDDTVRVGA